MKLGLIVTGGVDRSGTVCVIPSLLHLIERLARRHEVHVFSLHHYDEPCTYELLGATIHDLGRVSVPRGFSRRAQTTRLRTALQNVGRFDVLHAFQAMPAGSVATAAADRIGVPCVVTIDSGEWVSLPEIGYGLQRQWWHRRAVAETVRRAARVTVCTDYMATLARRHGVNVEVLPLGVPQVMRESEARRAAVPPWRLIHIASVNAVKDHATLLWAMAVVAAAEPRTHLDVIGEDRLGGQARARARELGLDAHVTFHGFLPTAQVMEKLACAHVHIVSSRHEAAGVVTLEAASVGVPTVGTQVGYVADWAPDRAVAVPVADSAALGAAIVDLLRDRERRDRIAVAARTWARVHDADWTAAACERLYAGAVGAS